MNTPLNLRQIIFRLLIGAGVSFLLLALLLYSLSDLGESLNLSKLIDVIKHIAPKALLLYLICQFIGIGLRSLRYQYFLKTAGDKTKPKLNKLIPVTMIRNMTVDMLPSRVGELVFVGLLKKTNKTHASHSLSALVFSTLFDIAIILPIVLFLALFVLTENNIKAPMFVGVGVLIVILVSFYFAMKYLAPYLSKHISKLADNYSNKWLEKLANFSRELNSAIQSSIHSEGFYRVILLSLGLRLFKYLGLAMLFWGVVNTSFPELNKIPFGQLISVLIAGETTASLPIPTFLSFGAYEVGSVAMLKVFSINGTTALVIMLAVHLASQAIDYTLGLLAIAWLMFQPQSSISKNKPSTTMRAKFIGSSIFAIIGLTIVYFGFQSTRQAWSINSPPSGIAVKLESHDNKIVNWDGSPGFIVWSSNRNGNHDIYHMTLPGLKVTQLTDHPNTENLAKISPNGRKIVFLRSRKTWQSFRDPSPWDIIIKDIQSGDEKMLAQDATDPNWLPDGKRVSIRRNNSQVYFVDIKTGKQKLAYESKMLNLPGNAGLQTPMINTKGDMAVTVRGPLRMTALVIDNQLKEIGRGCQITWSPNEDFIYYIDHGGKGQNLLRRYDIATGENKVWMDMPSEYSHEYFPKLTTDGKWLVFAASTGGHEHDTADYELFLWETNSDPKDAIRLTFHSGNDSWPDIYKY